MTPLHPIAPYSGRQYLRCPPWTDLRHFQTPVEQDLDWPVVIPSLVGTRRGVTRRLSLTSSSTMGPISSEVTSSGRPIRGSSSNDSLREGAGSQRTLLMRSWCCTILSQQLKSLRDAQWRYLAGTLPPSEAHHSATPNLMTADCYVTRIYEPEG